LRVRRRALESAAAGGRRGRELARSRPRWIGRRCLVHVFGVYSPCAMGRRPRGSLNGLMCGARR